MSVKEDMFGYSPPEVSVLRPKSTVGMVPGMGCGDFMMIGLGTNLEDEGLEVFYSGISLNWLWTSFQVGRLAQSLLKAAERGRKVDLVGHSLGGIYSMYMAEKYPNLIRKVITLGTPLLGHPRQAASPIVRAFGDLYLYDDLGVFNRSSQLPEGVEFHSIYTKGDEVIDHRTCLDPRINLHLVTGSHLGLPNNRQVQTKIKEILIT